MAKKGNNPKAEKVALLVLNEGKSMAAAMKEVGYSPSYAKSPHQLTDTKTWEELMDKYIPDSLLADTHKDLFEGIKVTKLLFDALAPDEDINRIVHSGGGIVLSIYTIYSRDRKGKVVDAMNKVVHASMPDKWSRNQALDKAYKIKGRYKETIQLDGSITTMTSEELKKRKAVLEQDNKLLIQRFKKYGKEKKAKTKAKKGAKRKAPAKSGRGTKAASGK